MLFLNYLTPFIPKHIQLRCIIRDSTRRDAGFCICWQFSFTSSESENYLFSQHHNQDARSKHRKRNQIKWLNQIELHIKRTNWRNLTDTVSEFITSLMSCKCMRMASSWSCKEKENRSTAAKSKRESKSRGNMRMDPFKSQQRFKLWNRQMHREIFSVHHKSFEIFNISHFSYWSVKISKKTGWHTF